ncbi:PhoH family protein [Streptomonospora nanhaiensis]|uniref:PhoH family protein n=1 Tax=Streptomonospora nanhaiensis TaxID=1323731 RepID=UPI0015CE3021|nr:PhoH family protein [Streptomonospora nanhaiensis]MBV2362868.1 PhoH family protein [Streptomonospora nanhaiensis]
MLDTSVLLADPASISRFAEHAVVLPIVVITELESKRHHPELGYFAREALRRLDDLRVEHGTLDVELPVNDQGGTLRVELNHSDPTVLPAGFRLGDNDTRILTVACNLQAELADEGGGVVLVSKDLPMRIKASSIGLRADEYRAELPVEHGWTGMAELEVPAHEVAALFEDGTAEVEAARDLPCHTGLVLVSERGKALGRVLPDKSVKVVKGDRDVFGLHGRSAEQRIALDLLTDPDVGIVSLGGRAGTGKSALALCAGLDAVLERGQHRKVMVFRPLYAVGGQELGYLPGTENEKMSPWSQAVHDTLSAVTSPEVIEEVVDRGMLEVLPLTHIRGRSLHDAFVIVDEAQSLERGVLLTVLSRLGENSRVVLTHDIAQRDNLRVGRYDGVVAVVEKLKGHPLFAHITLTRSERSPIAALVTEMLEG